MAKKITINNLSQTKHVKFLMLLEKQSKLGFELVLKKLYLAIGKSLKKEGLAKSDDPSKLDEGWSGEVAKIEIDLEGAIAKVVDRHFKALQYMIMGDYAGKEAKAAAKELGLKVVPGMMQSAYLQSIDAHREHHKAVTGEEAPEIPKPLLKASMDEIAKRSKRFVEKATNDMKHDILETVDKVVRKTNQDSINRVHKEAHDLLPSKGSEEALSEAMNMSWDYVKMKDIKKELDNIEEKLVNKWDLTSCGELANASATGTHQAMVEIYGGRDDSVRVVWMTLEDERVCSFCNEVSKDKSGNYKYYKISDFRPAGWNYGKKKSEWELQVPPGHPRCFVDDISVYTNQGWKKWPDVDGTELFYSVNLETGSAEWVNAVKVVKYHYKGQIDWFSSRKTDFATTPNHTHVVKFRKKKKGRSDAGEWKLVNGEELPTHDFSFLGSVPNWQGHSPEFVEIGSYKFKTNDFAKFMGMFLSEGNISKPKSGKWQIKISQTKYKSEFVEISKRLFDTVWDGKEAHYIPLDDEIAIDYFRQFGKSWEKFIPDSVLSLSKSDLRDFITYFRMGDGSLKENNKLSGAKKTSYSECLFTSSEKMMGQLCEIITKIGMRPSYKLQPAKICKHKNGEYLTKHPCWSISLGTKPAASMDYTIKEKIPYDGLVYDVELSKNHTLMVSRNGKVIISGNCRCDLIYVPAGFKVGQDGSLEKK